VNIIIPARRGSTGVPYKNRILLKNTLSKIPLEHQKKTIITTNDEVIAWEIKKSYSQCKIHHRSESSAKDAASTKESFAEVIEDFSLDGDIVGLYLTYPEREWDRVMDAYRWFKEIDAGSLLCREETLTHPYLCMYEAEGNKGRPIIDHDLYRRQDYPRCFRISHFIFMFKSEEFKKLNNNLYNEETAYYPVPSSLDIDTSMDLEKLRRK